MINIMTCVRILLQSLFLLKHVISQDTCLLVHKTLVGCLNEGSVSISCPNYHWIVIVSAQYFVTEQLTCPPADPSDNCLVTDVVNEINDGCHRKVQCDVTLTHRYSSTCTGATSFVWIQYQCEALHNREGSPAQALSMTCTDKTFTGTLLDVNSHSRGLIGTYITRTRCSCAFTVPANTGIFMELMHFYKRGNTGARCDQKIKVWNHDESYTFCASNVSRNLTCQNEEKTYYVEYITPAATSVQVIFVLQLSAPYDSDGITIECGIPSIDLPDYQDVDNNGDARRSQPVSPATYPSTQHTSLAYGTIVLGCSSGAFVFILSITVLVICLRRRRKGASPSLRPGSAISEVTAVKEFKEGTHLTSNQGYSTNMNHYEGVTEIQQRNLPPIPKHPEVPKELTEFDSSELYIIPEAIYDPIAPCQHTDKDNADNSCELEDYLSPVSVRTVAAMEASVRFTNSNSSYSNPSYNIV